MIASRMSDFIHSITTLARNMQNLTSKNLDLKQSNEFAQ